MVTENIIWATGFKADYSWINVMGAFDKKGAPIHNRGISPIKGLYFLGLPWQYRRGSSLIQGVGADANFLFEHLKQNS